MFRIEFQESGHTTVLKIYGRLTEQYLESARSLVVRSQPKSRIIADLCEMTYVDEAGEQFLTWLKCIGAQFAPGNLYCIAVCERLRLPRAEGYVGPANDMGGEVQVRYTFASRSPHTGKTRHRKAAHN
jgi:hypothetical protein